MASYLLSLRLKGLGLRKETWSQNYRLEAPSTEMSPEAIGEESPEAIGEERPAMQEEHSMRWLLRTDLGTRRM